MSCSMNRGMNHSVTLLLLIGGLNIACHLFQKNLLWGTSLNCSSCQDDIKKAIH